MRTALEWLAVSLVVVALFCGLVVFTTTFGYEAACGFYRYLVRLARRWKSRRLVIKPLNDEEIYDWLAHSSEKDS
jgi:hypothetical protein